MTDWAGGAIASNVYALKFTFNGHPEHGYVGYSEIVVQGTPSSTVSARPLIIATENEHAVNPPLWAIETTSSLIYGVAASAFDMVGNSTSDNCYGITALTDGAFPDVGSAASYSSMGAALSCASVTYSLDTTTNPNGYDLTNIVSYSGWADGGLDGQFYTVSYSSVLNPDLFVPITTVCFNPPRTDNLSMANRVAISLATGAALATNVGAVKFDFAPDSENGRCCYAELVVGGTPSLKALAALPPAPVLTNWGPATATATVGDKMVVLNAADDGTVPATYQWQKNGVNISGATGTSLTLTNLQLADAGIYRLSAFNATNGLGVTNTPFIPVIVSAVPAAVNNSIIKYAAQTGLGGTSYFVPTWEKPGNSLIAGQTSPTVGIGNFYDPDTNPAATNTAGGVGVLTDGDYGYLDNSGLGHPTFATCGVNGAGNSVTYVLGTASRGYDVTNIQTYGGWSNAGRDEQKYTVRYSTVAAPTVFNTLVTVDYNPSNPANAQSMSRVTIVPASTALAQSVYALMFDFNMGGASAKNGYEGYSEIVVGGTPTSAAPPILVNDITALGVTDVVGGKVTLSASFSGAASYQWKKDGAAITGATTPTISLNNMQVTDSGVYTLSATSAGGTSSTRGCVLTITPVPAAVNNVITAIAAQNDDAPVWSPTWVNSTNNSLIAGQLPSDSAGNFNQENQAGDRNVATLTAVGDLSLSIIGDPVTTSPDYVTAGQNAGAYLTYSLGSAPNGYNLTNIVVIGGWGDRGRDQQAYTIRYSTVTSPTVFQTLTVVNYNPPIGDGVHSAVRETLTAANGVLASNVAMVQFDFTTPGVENGYTGYGAINVLGTPSALPPPVGIVFTTENQNTATPAWPIETASLIEGQMPADAGGAGAWANFTAETSAGPSVLTDGQYLGVTLANYATCGAGAGTAITYTSPNGWNLTNIVVYSGWGNYNRDGQFYDVYYSTMAAPRTWIKLTSVYYNPAAPAGVDGSTSPSANRVGIAMSNGGLLAANVYAVKFDFSVQTGTLDNGYSGYAEIVLQGSELPVTQPVITVQHEQGANSWSVEPDSLIAGKLPTSFTGGATAFTGEGCNVTNLTDGALGFGSGYGASCGADANMVNTLTYASANGWNLNEIVTYTLWQDFGRDGQYYDVSYSTLANPTTFLPLASVTYNPFVPLGTPSGNRVSIDPMPGQTMLASNVAAIKFDFTGQANSDYNWSGYTELVLLGSNMAVPVAPVVNPFVYSGGNLILTGTGGTANRGYGWLTSTNVAAPLSQWTTYTNGVLDSKGAFSNAIPVGASEPAQFFKLKMQ